MQTLHDFMMHTKGISYLFAVILMVGFLFFWLFLVDRERKK